MLRSRPLATSQSRTVLSAEAVASMAPSGEESTAGSEGERAHRPGVATEDREIPSGIGLPEPDGLVASRGGQEPRGGRKRQREDLTGMAGEQSRCGLLAAGGARAASRDGQR